MVTLEQLNNIKTRLTNIYEYLHIEDMQIQLDELVLKTADPEFYNGTINTEEIFNNISQLKKYISDYTNASQAYDDALCMYELSKDDDTILEEVDTYYDIALKAIEKAEERKILSEEGDNLGCIITVNAGAGGTEAEDWAAMLTRMYLMYTKNKGYNVDVLDLVTGLSKDLIKSCSIRVDGLNAYGYLKSEIGVHRLVRVSPYNAQGKRMTSFASIFVTPLVDDSIEVFIDKSKLTWETFRSSGAGGQNVNKVETGVRARYLYTDPDTGVTEEILVTNTETRKQHDNKERAEQQLKSILYNKALQKKLEKQREIEDTKMKIEWGAQIRSYVFDDKRVKDHRTNYQTTDVDAVMNGDIEEFIKSYLLMK